ncbi:MULTISPECIES: hypothetical protein [Staphylococcus]|uniref:hypothetical protein n=1 Tax=Staphylococcus TaxID=1279 RepID=UPI001FDAB122|nr:MULTISPECIES: hypothetical protein [Staphylococcus]WIL69519.1 hypothetical protein QMK35_12510 [Staphylococcus cohnii]
MDILEDIDKVKWNFITLVIGIISFINLNIQASEFVNQYGNQIHVKNLFVDGYTTGTLKIIGLMLLTVAIFALTIYLAYLMGSSFFGFLQIIISLVLIIWSLVLAWAPFIGTLIIIMIIGGLFYLIANDY